MWKMRSGPGRSLKNIRVNNLSQRIITGGLYVVATLGAIYLSPLVMAVLFLVVAIMSQREFLRTFKGRSRPHLWLSFITGFLVYTGFALHGMAYVQAGFLVWLILPLGVVFVFELYRNKENPFLNIGTTLMSLIYTVVPVAFLNYIYFYGAPFEGPDFQFILAFFVMIWINDSMAFVVGILFGKHKFFPRISPKKSWEGFFGGLVFTALAGYGFYLIFDSLELWQWLGYALLITIFATYGDLIESMLKRDFEVKDSGNILPGHGGMLDRFDGVLLASPGIFLYLNLIL